MSAPVLALTDGNADAGPMSAIEPEERLLLMGGGTDLGRLEAAADGRGGGGAEGRDGGPLLGLAGGMLGAWGGILGGRSYDPGT